MPAGNSPHTQQSLESLGITNVNTVYWNLSTPSLIEAAIRRREGRLAHLGPLVVRTDQHTAPNDKFIVRDHPASTKFGGEK
jgi:phosphoenolpyruvate carboxykinase (ATP)